MTTTGACILTELSLVAAASVDEKGSEGTKRGVSCVLVPGLVRYSYFF